MKDPNRTFLGLYPETRALLRVLGLVFLAEVALLAAGFAFLLIVHGLVFALFLSARYWEPASNLMAWVLHRPEEARTFMSPPASWWGILVLTISMTARLGMIGFGLWILFTTGFCGQNFICLLAK